MTKIVNAETERRTADEIRSELVSYLRNHPSDMLIKIAEQRRDWAEQASWDSMSDVFRAQSLRKAAFEIASFLTWDGDGHPTPAQVIELVETADTDATLYAYARWTVIRTGRRHPRDPFSRSTNQISNLVEDCDRWAEDTIIDRFRYYAPVLASYIADVK